MKLISFFLVVFSVGLGFGTPLQGAPVLVGHAVLQGQTLDAEGIKAVLLGKRIMLGDTRVVIVIAKSSPAQDTFLQAHIGMTSSQFQNHWRRLFMTGGGTAPKIVEDEDAARKLVVATPGAISVMDASKAEGLPILVDK